MRRPHVPTRATIALLTGLVLAAPTVALQTGAITSAQSAAPTGDCAVAYPTGDVTVGQAVHGLTTTQGTTPTAFTGEVLGVLKDGILPGIDLVMARLDSTEINRVGGIWQGMSGSPVYAADGRLIGAVAYGFSFGASPVAGITPYPQMQVALNRSLPTRIHIGDKTARLIAKQAGVSKKAAQQGLEQLPTPLAVSGVSASILNRDRTRPYQPKAAYPVGNASGAPAAPTADNIVAGGNLGVTYSTGDITQGAFGTVTSVCNGLVRGFGHPFNLLGSTTYAMTGADTLYIQEDPAGTPFTVANFGAPVGTINQDRTTGVSGPLGTLPTGATVTSILTHGTTTRASASTVTIQEALAQTTNYALVVNHQRVLDAFPPGAEVQTWTITGHQGTTAFTLHGGNRYADANDITGIAQWDLPDLVWILGFVPDVTIDSVRGTSIVTDDASVSQLVRVEQRTNGAWVKLGKTTPAHAKAGKSLRLRLVLSSPSGTTTVPLTYKIPTKAAGQRGKLFLDAGFAFPFEQDAPPTSLAGVKKLLRTMVRTDQVRGDLTFFGEKGAITLSKKSKPGDHVINGNRRVKVIVD
ncbi:MAG: SpoIVB peptidase S55 domain-containing protein [Nocardioides sp.]